MSDIEIINCHTHLFTDRHVPANYPYRFTRLFRRTPRLIRLIARTLQLLAQHRIADKLMRLYRFQIEATAPDQRTIFKRMALHYPSNTRFVVLPMDLSAMGYGAPEIPLNAQHDELAELVADPDLGKQIIPFAMIDPRADPEARELWRAIDELGFRGVKIYPALGYAPTDPVLMKHVYPEMERRGLPLMTHCSRGGVQGRDVSDFEADGFSHPTAYVDVMKEFPNLRICLAHFGGDRDWNAYVSPQPSQGFCDEYDDNWQVKIREMICSGAYPNLYTDISYTLFRFEDNIPFLRLFLRGDDQETRRLRARVLFGSDHYMTTQENLSERAVCFRLRNDLGEETFRQIADTNVRAWMGEALDP